MSSVASTSLADALALAAAVCVLVMAEEEDDGLQLRDDDVEMMVRDEMHQAARNKRKRVLDEDGNPAKRQLTKYNRERAMQCVNEDYFDPRPTFDDRHFERFFRISPAKAEYILSRLVANDPTYWTLTYDCCGRMSIDPKVKLLAALKMAAYGEAFTAWQDYFQMGDSTARECLSKLMRVLVEDEDISQRFLRKMTQKDARDVERMHFERFLIHGYLGGLDMSQIPWGNCPYGQRGQHTGKSGAPTLGLEAACDYNTWFWHWCFGSPGSLNDINAWEKSSLLHDLTHGRMNEIDFTFKVNGESFDMLFWTVDLIYPKLARFLRGKQVPMTKVDRLFTATQIVLRQCIERGLGVWKKKFHSVAKPIQLFYVEDIWYLVGGTLTLHNMMVKERIDRDQEESEAYYELVADHDPQYNYDTSEVSPSAAAKEAIAEEDRQHPNQFQILTRNMRYVQFYWEQLTDVQEHIRLQDAVKHQIYHNRYGENCDGDELASFDPFEDYGGWDASLTA